MLGGFGVRLCCESDFGDLSGFEFSRGFGVVLIVSLNCDPGDVNVPEFVSSIRIDSLSFGSNILGCVSVCGASRGTSGCSAILFQFFCSYLEVDSSIWTIASLCLT